MMTMLASNIGGGGLNVDGEVADMEVDQVADMVVKVPDEDFSYMTLANGDIYEMMLKLVMDIDVDKQADEVAEMQTDMEMKRTIEEFIDVTLAIGGQISN